MATPRTDLLADLVSRDLADKEGFLCVLDGSKALAAGVKRVFGKHAVMQRCTLHYAEERIYADLPTRSLVGQGFHAEVLGTILGL